MVTPLLYTDVQKDFTKNTSHHPLQICYKNLSFKYNKNIPHSQQKVYKKDIEFSFSKFYYEKLIQLLFLQFNVKIICSC